MTDCLTVSNVHTIEKERCNDPCPDIEARPNQQTLSFSSVWFALMLQGTADLTLNLCLYWVDRCYVDSKHAESFLYMSGAEGIEPYTPRSQV